MQRALATALVLGGIALLLIGNHYGRAEWTVFGKGFLSGSALILAISGIWQKKVSVCDEAVPRSTPVG